MDMVKWTKWKADIVSEAIRGLGEPHSIFKTFQRINERHDLLHQEIMECAARELSERSDAPALSYCWVEMGSGGRLERTLWTDQDNGIVYYCQEQDVPAVESHLGKLSEMVVQTLSDVGYSPCTGRVMANNPRWRRSTKGWEQNWEKWTQDLSLDHIRYLLISADMRPLYGEVELAEELKNGLYENATSSPWLPRLAEHSLQQSVPLGIFRNLLLQDFGEYTGMFHLKRGGYYQLVSLIRVLALRAGVSDASTLERIHSLSRLGYFSPLEASALEAALAFFLTLRLSHHVQLWQKGAPLHDFIALSKSQRSQLKDHLLFIRNQQHKWIKRFGQGSVDS